MYSPYTAGGLDSYYQEVNQLEKADAKRLLAKQQEEKRKADLMNMINIDAEKVHPSLYPEYDEKIKGLTVDFLNEAQASNGVMTARLAAIKRELDSTSREYQAKSEAYKRIQSEDVNNYLPELRPYISGLKAGTDYRELQKNYKFDYPFLENPIDKNGNINLEAARYDNKLLDSAKEILKNQGQVLRTDIGQSTLGNTIMNKYSMSTPRTKQEALKAASQFYGKPMDQLSEQEKNVFTSVENQAERILSSNQGMYSASLRYASRLKQDVQQRMASDALYKEAYMKNPDFYNQENYNLLKKYVMEELPSDPTYSSEKGTIPRKSGASSSGGSNSKDEQGFFGTIQGNIRSGVANANAAKTYTKTNNVYQAIDTYMKDLGIQNAGDFSKFSPNNAVEVTLPQNIKVAKALSSQYPSITTLKVYKGGTDFTKDSKDLSSIIDTNKVGSLPVTFHKQKLVMVAPDGSLVTPEALKQGGDMLLKHMKPKLVTYYKIDYTKLSDKKYADVKSELESKVGKDEFLIQVRDWEKDDISDLDEANSGFKKAYKNEPQESYFEDNNNEQ